MARLGLPVPPGFTITCKTCMGYANIGNEWQQGVLDQIDAATRDLEERMGKRLPLIDDPVGVRAIRAVLHARHDGYRPQSRS